MPKAKWGSKQTIETRISYKLKLSHDVFKKKLMPNNEFLSCKVLDILPYLNDGDHVSIGCNLNDRAVSILQYLSRYKRNSKAKSVECDIVPYILLLHTLESAIQGMFSEMKTGIKIDSSKIIHFTIVRKWANFFKHPKSFVYLSHHPKYTFDNSQIEFDRKPELLIDTDFVIKYYHDKVRDEQLKLEIKGKHPVLVKLPDLIELTDGFADSANYYFDLILNSDKALQYIMNNCIMPDFDIR